MFADFTMSYCTENSKHLYIFASVIGRIPDYDKVQNKTNHTLGFNDVSSCNILTTLFNRMERCRDIGCMLAVFAITHDPQVRPN